MCGICGAIGFQRGGSIVQIMNQKMVHRGPDSEGYFDSANIHLGMRRLRIIDLQGGDQPVFNETGEIAIVFNGEIYNFSALRTELEEAGHIFRTSTDTEAIVHAYEEWGRDCVSHLQGMFAFAISDERATTAQGTAGPLLFLARDRLGIKPLYVWHDDRQLLFASEVRALLASGEIKRNVDTGGLYTYLLFGAVQEPLTLVENVYSIPSASWCMVRQHGNHLHIERATFWEPPTKTNKIPPTMANVRQWLTNAVESHLVSDAPLGSFLSGGLDSGSIVAIASRASRQPLRTFTLGFDNWPDDERMEAQKTALRHGTEHMTIVISEAEAIASLPQALASMDLPSIDAVNTWFVSSAARKSGLTVALSGVGGDEIFAGYPSFKQLPSLTPLFGMTRWIPSPILENLLGRITAKPDRSRKLGELLAGHGVYYHPYFAVRGLFTEQQVLALLSEITRDSLKVSQSLTTWYSSFEEQVRVAERYDDLGRVSWLELTQYMRSTLLRDTDAMSMAHSLEVRVPFVDHNLIEQVLPIPAQFKYDQRQSKRLLAGAMYDLLPKDIVKLRKRTFTLPFASWLSNGMFDAISKKFRDYSNLTEYGINAKYAQDVWQAFADGHTTWSRPWAIYVLCEWLRLNEMQVR